MLVCASFYPLHARPRVQRASGSPCSLFSGRTKVKARAGHAARSRSRIWLAPDRLDCTIAVEPHPEEPAQRASRRMKAAVVRDGSRRPLRGLLTMREGGWLSVVKLST